MRLPLVADAFPAFSADHVPNSLEAPRRPPRGRKGAVGILLTAERPTAPSPCSPPPLAQVHATAALRLLMGTSLGWPAAHEAAHIAVFLVRGKAPATVLTNAPYGHAFPSALARHPRHQLSRIPRLRCKPWKRRDFVVRLLTVPPVPRPAPAALSPVARRARHDSGARPVTAPSPCGGCPFRYAPTRTYRPALASLKPAAADPPEGRRTRLSTPSRASLGESVSGRVAPSWIAQSPCSLLYQGAAAPAR